ncbi:MAG: ThiF family adenylyltransferase [Planctomycetales bacterium]
MDPQLARYSRQILFHGIGEAGQRALLQSRVLICGVGALGTVLAETLCRAGVGYVRLVDRDFIELTNLQRQVLFDEEDLKAQLPKAVAAARKLALINSEIQIDPLVAEISPANVLDLCRDVDLILDGTDNFETRFLINDAALELSKPWIYAGCIGSHGQMLPIFPGKTACLRCLIESPPPPGASETCDTAGVLAPAINVIASLQATAALKILTGQADKIPQALTIVDVWSPTLRQMQTHDLRDRASCPACFHGERLWLNATRGQQSTSLCGRNAVQIVPADPLALSLPALAEKLQRIGSVSQNPFLIKFQPQNSEQSLTIFPDGRTIVSGTDDPIVAKTLFARYVGS